MADMYISVKAEASAEYTDRKSVFIGYVKPVATKEEALEFISSIRKKHSDARHNVFAYVTRHENSMGYSDDGEPQGTAGMPVLDVIRKKGLTDVAIVVTRYFGGILLGTGGLVRAYTQAAAEAVKSAGEARYDNYCEFILTCDYSDYGKVTFELEKYTKKIIDTDFGENVKIRFIILGGESESFLKKITELSCGRIVPEKLCEKFFCPDIE